MMMVHSEMVPPGQLLTHLSALMEGGRDHPSVLGGDEGALWLLSQSHAQLLFVASYAVRAAG